MIKECSFIEMFSCVQGAKVVTVRNSSLLLKLINNSSSRNKENYNRKGGSDFHDFTSSFTPWISFRLRRYIKNSRQCFMGHPNTLKLVKNTPLRVVSQLSSRCLVLSMKHCLSCLIFYGNSYELNVQRSQFLPRNTLHLPTIKRHWVSYWQFLEELHWTLRPRSPFYYGHYFCPGETPVHFLYQSC